MTLAFALWTACAPAPLPDADAVHAEALLRFDLDGDGRVTAAEWEVYDPAGSPRVDTDRDTYVSAAELAAWLAATPPAGSVDPGEAGLPR